MRSFSFLINPISGGGGAPEAVIPVTKLLREAGAQVEVTYTTGPEGTVDLVSAAADRGDVVVAVGGDGMVSSIAGEVARHEGVLGLLPAGRGNDFARMLGLSKDAGEVAAVLLDGEERPVDLIEATLPGLAPQRVAGSVYSGVDSRASEIVDRVRWMPSKLQYPYASVHALATYVPTELTVEVDGVASSYVAATVVVANSGYYGKGMRIAPNAVVDDGLLDVIVVEAAQRRGMIKAMPKVYDGSHVELDQVTELRGKAVRLSGTPSLPMGGDGEPLGMLPTSADDPAVVSVLPGALNVLF
ncbi:MAG: diacylglycerol kinase family protein [Aeromicrobium sp.]|uniref:diacylglycerol/lipid kinase family protein n=1 Tax=Aeromicrobium sp. TaxID=1871063 RepID=UPI0039E475D5